MAVCKNVEQRKLAHHDSGNKKMHIPLPGASSHLSILNYVPGYFGIPSICI